jgi:hypothetical protein
VYRCLHPFERHLNFQFTWLIRDLLGFPHLGHSHHMDPQKKATGATWNSIP